MKKITEIKSVRPRIRRKKLRVAAYCRVSTASDAQLESLETQKAYYENYISSRPDWKLADIYFDEGISGTKLYQRPALQRLLADCESRQIDMVVTKSLSRLSRNTMDCLEIVRKLQSLDIPIYFEKEALNTATMESELMLSVMSSVAEGESASTAQNINWSIQHRFKNGNYKLCSPPYGYSWNGDNLQIVPDKAAIVKEIFTKYLAGTKVISIIDDLNKRGVATPRHGPRWQRSTIAGILSNEKYTGDVIFQKTYTAVGYKRRCNHGERNQYLYKAHHEAIISHEEFKQAQSLKANHCQGKGIIKSSDKGQSRYTFSGKIICNECGSSFKRRIHKYATTSYVAWICGTHLKDKAACPMLFIRNDDLELAFITMLNKLIYSRKIILAPLSEKLKLISSDNTVKQIRDLETELMQITEKRQTLLRLKAEGYLDQIVFTQESNLLETRRKELTIELNSLENNGTKGATELNELKRLLYFTKHSKMLNAFNEALFTEYVHRIHVYSRQEIGFELKCGLILRERI